MLKKITMLKFFNFLLIVLLVVFCSCSSNDEPHTKSVYEYEGEIEYVYENEVLCKILKSPDNAYEVGAPYADMCRIYFSRSDFSDVEFYKGQVIHFQILEYGPDTTHSHYAHYIYYICTIKLL